MKVSDYFKDKIRSFSRLFLVMFCATPCISLVFYTLYQTLHISPCPNQKSLHCTRSPKPGPKTETYYELRKLSFGELFFFFFVFTFILYSFFLFVFSILSILLTFCLCSALPLLSYFLFSLLNLFHHFLLSFFTSVFFSLL